MSQPVDQPVNQPVSQPVIQSRNPDTYVIQGAQLKREDWLRLSNWLPSFEQMAAAARLQIMDAVDPFERGAVTVTMRQGLGMIAVLGLIAGIIPLIANLWLALPLQTSVPLAQAGSNAAQMAAAYDPNSPLGIIGSTVQTMTGLPPRIPGVFAALLSALGMWINTPLTWLAWWIVYGTLVFAAARLMGASNTLQTFFAATSFAAVPLLLTGFAPIPWIGPLLFLAGDVLAAAVYYLAMQLVTRLDAGRTALCMLLPLAVGIVLPLVALGVGLFVSLFV
jgi:hypothetical protein